MSYCPPALPHKRVLPLPSWARPGGRQICRGLGCGEGEKKAINESGGGVPPSFHMEGQGEVHGRVR